MIHLSHIEEIYSRVENILKYQKFLLILFFLAFGIWTLPWPFSMPGSGLDPSWGIGISKAVSDNFQFGPDIAFTFGPLGFLYFPSYIDPALWFLSFIFSLLIHFLFLISLALLMIKSSANWKEYIVVLALVIIPINFIRDYELLLSVGIFLYLIFSSKLNRKYEVHVLSFVSLLLAIASLIKTNIAIISLSIILIFLLLCIFKKEFQKHLYVFILYFTFVPILWLIAGQHLTNLPVYLLNSIQLSSGYNDAMAIHGPEWQIYIGLIGIIFILVLFLYSLVKRMHDLVVFILLNGVLLFIVFKHGFVRHDSHVYGFFASYAIIFVYVYLISKSKTNFAVRSVSLLLSILFVVSIYNGFPNIMQDNIFLKLPAYEKSFSLMSNQTYQDQVVLDAKYNIKRSYPLDNNSIHFLNHNNKTLDIFPWDIALVWAYDFTWSPRPVFQSYSAYTQKLDMLNAQHFSDLKAPKAILYSYKSIDGRYPLFDEPATFESILNNYTFVNKSGEFLLLSYDPEKNIQKTEEDLGTVNVGLGNTIKIPKYDSGYIFGQIELGYSTFGSFMKLIYKPALAHIRFRFYDRTDSEDFRFITGVSMNGVFLSQYVSNVDDLASIFSENITQDITEMMIEVDDPAYYMKNVKVKFVGVPANITVQNNSYASMPDWRLLKRVQGGKMWIDTVGKKQYAQGNIIIVDREKEQFVSINGWAADDKEKDGTIKKFLVLIGGKEEIVVPTKKKFRPDVANYFGFESYMQSGWEATIRSNEFKDCFNISVRILRENGEEYYELNGEKPICFS